MFVLPLATAATKADHDKDDADDSDYDNANENHIGGYGNGYDDCDAYDVESGH